MPGFNVYNGTSVVVDVPSFSIFFRGDLSLVDNLTFWVGHTQIGGTHDLVPGYPFISVDTSNNNDALVLDPTEGVSLRPKVDISSDTSSGENFWIEVVALEAREVGTWDSVAVSGLPVRCNPLKVKNPIIGPTIDVYLPKYNYTWGEDLTVVVEVDPGNGPFEGTGYLYLETPDGTMIFLGKNKFSFSDGGTGIGREITRTIPDKADEGEYTVLAFLASDGFLIDLDEDVFWVGSLDDLPDDDDDDE